MAQLEAHVFVLLEDFVDLDRPLLASLRTLVTLRELPFRLLDVLDPPLIAEADADRLATPCSANDPVPVMSNSALEDGMVREVAETLVALEFTIDFSIWTMAMGETFIFRRFMTIL